MALITKPVDPSKLHKMILIQKGIIIILALTLVSFVALYYIYKPKGFDFSLIRPQYLGPVGNDTAHPNLKIYRNNLAYASLSRYPSAKVHGILHTYKDFEEYTAFFKKFMDTHDPRDNTFEWQIGMYPMICKDSVGNKQRPRLGFYFIPTMVKKNIIIPNKPSSAEMIDYFDAINGPDAHCYDPKPGSIVADNRYIYDEGHLWP
jgi:hypothetical protein